MKFFIFLFFSFLFVPSVFTQENSYKITYNSLWTSGHWLVEAKGYLYFNSSQSYFKPDTVFTILHTRTFKNSVNGQEQAESKPPNKDHIHSPFDPFDLFTDLNDGQIFQSIIENDGNPLLLIENIASIGWEITSERKAVDKFTVQKATGSFRGREYTAWFTKDIPVSLGPWKLNGLPGLILEVNDGKNEVVFKAIVIEPIKPKKDLAEIYKELFSIKEQRTLEDYVSDREKKAKERFERLQRLVSSRAREHTSVNVSRSKSPTLEMEYEFLK